MRNKHQLLRRRRRLSTPSDKIRWQWLYHGTVAEQMRAQIRERRVEPRLQVIRY